MVQRLFIKGFFVLIPIMIVMVFVGELYSQTTWVVELFDEFFPNSDVATFLVTNAIVFALMFVLVVLLGALAESGKLDSIAERFDQSFRRYIPGYIQVQNTMRVYFSRQPWYSQYDVVKVDKGTTLEYGLEIERKEDEVLVFLPTTANGQTGNLISCPEERVKAAGISAQELLALLGVSTVPPKTVVRANNQDSE